jgi:predicted metal-binding protein
MSHCPDLEDAVMQAKGEARPGADTGPDLVLHLCATCLGTLGPEAAGTLPERLRARLAQAGLGTRTALRLADCLGACELPLPLGLQGPGRATYLFAGLRPEDDLDDIAATCRAYLDADAGWIEDARPCGRLRHCLRARIPALAGV